MPGKVLGVSLEAGKAEVLGVAGDPSHQYERFLLVRVGVDHDGSFFICDVDEHPSKVDDPAFEGPVEGGVDDFEQLRQDRCAVAELGVVGDGNEPEVAQRRYAVGKVLHRLPDLREQRYVRVGIGAVKVRGFVGQGAGRFSRRPLDGRLNLLMAGR